jgi:hypothetical protein
MKATLLLLMLFIAACGHPTGPEATDPSALFPHPDNYLTAGHGQDAADLGSTCHTCHAAREGTPSAGPPCASCHLAYPHGERMHDGGVHSKLWAAVPGACTDCHGDDGRERPTTHRPGACIDCHSTFPHAPGWRSPTVHGTAMLERGGAQACTNCHTAGDASDPGNCSTCHAAFPHTEGWLSRRAHGQAYRDDTAACSGCHSGTDPAGTPSCARCHDTYPHPETWRSSHVPAVQTRGAKACQTCHSAGYPRGPVIPVSCSDGCHGAGT